ncbi:MAG: hypothetical protein P8P74_03760 [Crocinitomicaceae bacterium]|nr:hypothetical protein [Crocinitomicaceae bacterium]
MKHILLSFILVLISFGSFASNKICVGEKVLVVFNENLKKLTVHDKESLEVLQSTDLEGSTFGEIALSPDEANIWFQTGRTMYCRSIESGEILKELSGTNAYKFELSAAQNYLVHYETYEDHALVYIYDLNTAEAVSYAKVDFVNFLETAHYDHEKQQLHLLSSTFASKTEKPAKEPMFGLPSTSEEIELHFRQDGDETRYFIYDIANKSVLYDEVIPYSPDFECNFEMINDELYIITALGTAKVKEDFSLEITSMVLMNMSDYTILASEFVGATPYFLYTRSFETDTYEEMDDDQVNLILIESDAIAMTETDYYCIKDGVFYRFKRSEPMNADFEMPLD